MLEDDDTDTAETSVSCGEIDLLEQLNKMNLSEGNTSGSDIVNVSQEEAISLASSKMLIRTNAVFNLQRASSKMKLALSLIQDEILPSNDKAIVVSQWTSVLNIFGKHLRAANVHFTELTGQVAVKLRNNIVVDFNKESQTKVEIVTQEH